DNHVYVYKKKDVDQYSFSAQIRSIGANSGRSSASATHVAVLRADEKLYVQVPHIRQRLPLYLVFCALGITEKRDIAKILFCGGDETDPEMIAALKPTLMTAHFVRQQNVALNYIGQRAAIVAATEDKRIQAAQQ